MRWIVDSREEMLSGVDDDDDDDGDDDGDDEDSGADSVVIVGRSILGNRKLMSASWPWIVELR